MVTRTIIKDVIIYPVTCLNYMHLNASMISSAIYSYLLIINKQLTFSGEKE